MLKVLLQVNLFRELWVAWQWKKRNTFVNYKIKQENKKLQHNIIKNLY